MGSSQAQGFGSRPRLSHTGKQSINKLRLPAGPVRGLATSPEAAVRDGAEALKLAAGAVDLTHGSDPRALDALAAAYAETGRFPEAVEAARRALAVAAPRLVPALKARIAMYERQEPFREK